MRAKRVGKILRSRDSKRSKAHSIPRNERDRWQRKNHRSRRKKK